MTKNSHPNWPWTHHLAKCLLFCVPFDLLPTGRGQAYNETVDPISRGVVDQAKSRDGVPDELLWRRNDPGAPVSQHATVLDHTGVDTTRLQSLNGYPATSTFFA